MPCTLPMVVSMRKSGTISTNPPIETTINAMISSSIEFFSTFLCLSSMILHPRQYRLRRNSLRAALDCHDDIINHDQGTTEKESPAQCTDDVIDEHLLGHLDERILQKPILIIRTPH